MNKDLLKALIVYIGLVLLAGSILLQTGCADPVSTIPGPVDDSTIVYRDSCLIEYRLNNKDSIDIDSILFNITILDKMNYDKVLYMGKRLLLKDSLCVTYRYDTQIVLMPSAFIINGSGAADYDIMGHFDEQYVTKIVCVIDIVGDSTVVTGKDLQTGAAVVKRYPIIEISHFYE